MEVEEVEVDGLHFPSTLPPGVGTGELELRTGKGRPAPSQGTEEQGTRLRIHHLHSPPPRRSQLHPRWLRLHLQLQLLHRQLCLPPGFQFCPARLDLCLKYVPRDFLFLF